MSGSFKLLSVCADAKTIKGSKLGVLTGVLYLAPHTLSGFQVCPKATAGCMAACLYTAGRGIYTKIQEARIKKTQDFFNNREEFMKKIVKDIEALIRHAERINYIPAVRLNGTSDLPWEKIKCVRDGKEYSSVMEAFNGVVSFYEYTKIPNRHKALSLSNYHLTFSLAENNDEDALRWLANGGNVAVVMNTKRKQKKPERWNGFKVIDGDETDVRFLDPKGVVIALSAKGKARHDKSGFVRDYRGNVK